MLLKNTLPPTYESCLLSVTNGKAKHDRSFDAIFRALNPARVTSITDEMRKALWSIESQGSDGWWMESKNIVKPILKSIEERPEISALFSVSWNGYVREKAVREWPRVNTSFELALLLIRLNDWVEQVRLAATLKLETFIAMPVSKSGLTQEIVLGCMDLILSTERFGRSKEIEFRVLNQLLNMNEMPYALANYITYNALDHAPRYLKHGLKRGILVDALPDMATKGEHPEVRRIATHALLTGEYYWKQNGSIHKKEIDLKINKTKLAATALLDKTPTVKCVALGYISHYKPTDLHTEETYRSHVADKRFSVVERAIYGLKTLGINYVNQVRQQISMGEISKRALEILGRYGTVEDGKLIFGQLKKVSENNKILALGAASKLGNRQAQDALQEIAFGQNCDEARKASHKLSKIDYSPDIRLVLNAIRSDKDVIKRGNIRLFPKLTTMKLALALSELEASPREVDSLNLWQLLRRKRNTGAFLPSDKEIVALKNSVDKTPFLKEEFYKTLGIKL
jgi:hypothetical protein